MRIFREEVSLDALNNMQKNTLVAHLGIEFTEIGEDYLCANIFLRGFLEPGTTYHTDTGIVDLKNTVGEIVLFDSLTVHGVKAYRHDDIRITLAMDIHHGIGKSITKTMLDSHPERYYKMVNK